MLEGLRVVRDEKITLALTAAHTSVSNLCWYRPAYTGRIPSPSNISEAPYFVLINPGRPGPAPVTAFTYNDDVTGYFHNPDLFTPTIKACFHPPSRTNCVSWNAAAMGIIPNGLTQALRATGVTEGKVKSTCHRIQALLIKFVMDALQERLDKTPRI